MRSRLLLVLLMPLLAFASASVLSQPIEVKVQKLGERVVVDVYAHAAVNREVAWAVLTDYEHMAQFVSNLKSSAVLSRNGNLLEVEQNGEAKYGFLHFSFSTVRAVELIDDSEIRSHLLRGDFKSYSFSTRLVADAAGSVMIEHHGEYIPKAWIPPVVGPSLIESGTRKQYLEMIAEMKRRQAGDATPSSPR
jgi:hypothetical protein